MRVRFDRFPGGKHKAVTLSFDDAKVHDRRFVQKLNEYGLKCTFHVNSGFLGHDTHINAEEVSTLYVGHEVSAHTVDHPFLEQSPVDQIVREVAFDRHALEQLCGYPVRGMSYPYGTYNDKVAKLLSSIGMEYARTIQSHGGFHMPDDFLKWHPTCHHKQMVEYAEKFVNLEQRHTSLALLYVWGHSYEFENDNNWEIIDQFGKLISGRNDIWYATNAEIYAYMKAIENLRFSIDSKLIHNPSALSVWISVEGNAVEIPGGQLVKL